MGNALRALIPVRGLVVDILDFLQISSGCHPTILCKVFEDNQGAYLLATNQRVSSRTKYFCVKHHFFWSYVYHPERNPEGWLYIIKVDTENKMLIILPRDSSYNCLKAIVCASMAGNLLQHITY